jgi:hypothetical protein
MFENWLTRIHITSTNYSYAILLAHIYNKCSYHTSYWQARSVQFRQYLGVPPSGGPQQQQNSYIVIQIKFTTSARFEVFAASCGGFGDQEHDSVLGKWFLMSARIMTPSSSGSKSVVGVATQRSGGASTQNLPTSTLKVPPTTTPNGLPPPNTCYLHPHTLPIYFDPHEISWTDQSWRWRHYVAFQKSALHNITSQKTSTTISTPFVVHFPLIHCCTVDIHICTFDFCLLTFFRVT